MPTLSHGQAQETFLQYLENNMPSTVLWNDCIYPNSGNNKRDNVPFFDIAVTWGSSVAVQAGMPALYRTPIIVVIDINVPKHDGDQLYTSIFDHLNSIFRNNQAFRDLGFVLEGITVDPSDERVTSDYYTQVYNVLCYIESY